nr:hypothetical protein BaRGS_009565 [Batillaria attramentaria]
MGTLSHWKIAKVFEAAYIYSLDAGAMGYTALDRQQHGLIFLGSVFEYDPTLWAIPAGTQFPFTVTVELDTVGTSSQTFSCRLINKLDSRILATQRTKSVYFSLEKRRPVPIPDHYRERYRSLAGQNVAPLVFSQTVPQVPESAFQYCMVVRHSDLDPILHTNSSSYVMFCCDAAQAAVEAEYLDLFRPDICLFPVQVKRATMEVVYLGESGIGDSLRVSLWQQDGQPSLVNYVISRDEGNRRSAIFYASMAYKVTPVKAHRL